MIQNWIMKQPRHKEESPLKWVWARMKHLPIWSKLIKTLKIPKISQKKITVCNVSLTIHHILPIISDQNIQWSCINVITHILSMQKRGSKERWRGKKESREVETERNERKEERLNRKERIKGTDYIPVQLESLISIVKWG